MQCYRELETPAANTVARAPPASRNIFTDGSEQGLNKALGIERYGLATYH
jgi:hypothetical protein